MPSVNTLLPDAELTLLMALEVVDFATVAEPVATSCQQTRNLSTNTVFRLTCACAVVGMICLQVLAVCNQGRVAL